MEDKIKALVAWLNKQYGDTYHYEAEKLKVRYRIVHGNYNPSTKTLMSGSISVYCFVDFEGNIYKAATWSRPAKHVRGHVDNLNTNDLGKYSPRYLK